MFAAVARTSVLRRSATLTGVRSVSSSAKSSSAILIGSASPSPSNTSPAAAQQQAAGLRTAAASAAPKLAASSPALGPSHALKDGRVFSANRLYHAISSESAPGLSQPDQEPNYTRKLQRMRDAKDLAGI